MIRLIGILVGSAFAVGFLILTLGLPALEVPTDGPVSQAPPVEPVSDTPPDEPVSETEPEVTAKASPPDSAVTDSERAAEVAVAATAYKEPGAPRESSSAMSNSPLDAVELSEPAEQRWYAFWSPFRSEIAADGFVSQLQRTTGLDYRVVKLKPGIYEVAFAYAAEDEIQAKLTQISTATGLDLTGG